MLSTTRAVRREPGDQKVERRAKAPSKEELAKLRNLYLGGMPFTDIVDELGMERSSVHRHLDRLEVERRGGSKLTTSDVKIAVERYEAGETLKAIGRDLGVHGDTVRRALVKAGVEIRQPARPDRPRKLTVTQVEECRRRRASGETLQSLANEHGVNRETLRRALVRRSGD